MLTWWCHYAIWIAIAVLVRNEYGACLINTKRVLNVVASCTLASQIGASVRVYALKWSGVAWVSPGWVSAWLVGLSGMAVCWNKVVLHGCHRAGFPPGWAGYVGWVCAGMSPSWVSAWLGGLCGLGVCWDEVILDGCHLAGLPPGWAGWRAGYVGWLYAGMRWCCMGVTELGFRHAGRAIVCWVYAGKRWCCMGVTWLGFRLAGRAIWAGCMLEWGGVAWVSPSWVSASLGGLCGMAVCWNEMVLHGCHLAGLPPGWAGRLWVGCTLEWGGVAWVSPGWASAWLSGLCSAWAGRCGYGGRGRIKIGFC